MKKLVFVCTGNTCRSPMAEALLKHLLPHREHQIFSCGLAAYDGLPVSEKTRNILKQKIGEDFSWLRTKPLAKEFLTKDSLLLAMTQAHRDQLRPHASQVMTLGEFVGKNHLDVPDPFGGTTKEYEKVYEVIESLIKPHLNLFEAYLGEETDEKDSA